MSTVMSKANPVAQNRIWQEHVHKESRVQTLNESFNITSPIKCELPLRPHPAD